MNINETWKCDFVLWSKKYPYNLPPLFITSSIYLHELKISVKMHIGVKMI